MEDSSEYDKVMEKFGTAFLEKDILESIQLNTGVSIDKLKNSSIKDLLLLSVSFHERTLRYEKFSYCLWMIIFIQLFLAVTILIDTASYSVFYVIFVGFIADMLRKYYASQASYWQLLYFGCLYRLNLLTAK